MKCKVWWFCFSNCQHCKSWGPPPPSPGVPPSLGPPPPQHPSSSFKTIITALAVILVLLVLLLYNVLPISLLLIVYCQLCAKNVCTNNSHNNAHFLRWNKAVLFEWSDLRVHGPVAGKGSTEDVISVHFKSAAPRKILNRELLVLTPAAVVPSGHWKKEFTNVES